MRLHRLRRTPPPTPPPQGGRGLSGLRRRRESHRHSQQKHVPLSRANCPFKANFSSPHPSPLPEGDGARCPFRKSTASSNRYRARTYDSEAGDGLTKRTSSSWRRHGSHAGHGLSWRVIRFARRCCCNRPLTPALSLGERELVVAKTPPSKPLAPPLQGGETKRDETGSKSELRQPRLFVTPHRPIMGRFRVHREGSCKDRWRRNSPPCCLPMARRRDWRFHSVSRRTRSVDLRRRSEVCRIKSTVRSCPRVCRPRANGLP